MVQIEKSTGKKNKIALNDLDEQEKVEQEVYQHAIDFIKKRYPTGWGGAAVMRTADGQLLTSVCIETIDEHVGLCIEVGALAEAAKYDLKVTHSICVHRDDEAGDFKVLSPCGICQERLRYYGVAVKVGVTTPNKELKFVRLDALQPYHWTNAFDDIVMYDDKHREK